MVVLGSLLQELAAFRGYFSQMPRYYGPQIRGGASGAKLSLDAARARIPGDTVDILVCFNWQKYVELQRELPIGNDSVVIYDSASPGASIALPRRRFAVPFSNTSKETTNSTSAKNIVALGLLSKMLDLPTDSLKAATLDREALAILQKDAPALNAGKHLLSEIDFPDLRLSPPTDPSAKIILHGNSAIAQAAIRAGCRAFFGYPITPAAEIMQEMQERLSQDNGVFLQAEDEIAALGMALGASLTGAKAMTATSGPGLDLMTEMIGLASSAEIPVVIADVQRCGPATGIPSKSEQSDLNHAIYGGHGDAPRVIIVPYDMEGCYRLIVESFNISEEYQVPVILLSDQWLAQTTVATTSHFLSRDYPLMERKRPALDYRGQYQRYEMTKGYVSPMASVGDERFTYQATGLAHDEKGRPSFDFANNQRMHEKRWHKLAALRDRDEFTKVFGREDVRRGIVTPGSSAQFVLETVEELGLQDKIKVCIPELIYPLPHKLADFVASLDKLQIVEMSYSAQFYHYLRSQIDLPSDTRVYARAGGLPLAISELSAPILELTR